MKKVILISLMCINLLYGRSCLDSYNQVVKSMDLGEQYYGNKEISNRFYKAALNYIPTAKDNCKNDKYTLGQLNIKEQKLKSRLK